MLKTRQVLTFIRSSMIRFNSSTGDNNYYSEYKKSYEKHAESFSHVDASGQASMVDVKDKSVTFRKATATASVLVGTEVYNLIKANNIKKGDVLTVAKIAGIMGAKKTPDLIPLCHPLDLTQVDVQCRMDEYESKIVIECQAKCVGRTGVEMEALTGASIAALTVYDMCKAVNKGILISDVKLLAKSGGKSGNFVAENDLPRDPYQSLHDIHNDKSE